MEWFSTVALKLLKKKSDVPIETSVGSFIAASYILYNCFIIIIIIIIIICIMYFIFYEDPLNHRSIKEKRNGLDH